MYRVAVRDAKYGIRVHVFNFGICFRGLRHTNYNPVLYEFSCLRYGYAYAVGCLLRAGGGGRRGTVWTEVWYQPRLGFGEI